MDAKELRIGNLVQISHVGGPDEVESLHLFDGINTLKPEYVKPVLLNREWYEKLGFIPNSSSRHSMAFGFDRYIEYWGSSGLYIRNNQNVGVFIYDIKYVHQLQNLMFALTGKELEIKEV